MKPLCIVIDGCIGAGKSTVLTKLKSEYNVKQEPQEKWTHLKDAYDRQDFSPEKVFLIQDQIIDTLVKRDILDWSDKIIERSLESSLIFTKTYSEWGNCDRFSPIIEKCTRYVQLFNDKFDVITIYLRLPHGESAKRMQARDGMCVPYIEELQENYDRHFLGKAIVIDAMLPPDEVYDEVIRVVKPAFQTRGHQFQTMLHVEYL